MKRPAVSLISQTMIMVAVFAITAPPALGNDQDELRIRGNQAVIISVMVDCAADSRLVTIHGRNFGTAAAAHVTLNLMTLDVVSLPNNALVVATIPVPAPELDDPCVIPGTHLLTAMRGKVKGRHRWLRPSKKDLATFDVAIGAGGLPGLPGADGANGADGTNGTNGVPGTNGTNGAPGTNGTNGAPGTNGIDGVSGYEVAQNTVRSISVEHANANFPGPSDPFLTASASCPGGKKPLGGGGSRGADSLDGIGNALQLLEFETSRPDGDAWVVKWRNNGQSNVGPVEVIVYAVCATVLL